MPLVAQINALEPTIQALSDEQLRAKTAEFRQRIDEARENRPCRPSDENRTRSAPPKRRALDEILPEAFAVVREAGKRAVGMRHFDVQMIGGMVLHRARSPR